MHAVVHQPFYGRGSHVHACVRTGVVDIHGAVGCSHPAVGKEHVHHIAHILFPHGCHKVPAGLCYRPPWFVRCGHVEIQHIAQSAGARAHAVCQVQPALGRLDGVGTLAVLHLFDGVVVAAVDDALFRHHGMFYVVHQCPADAAAVACFYEPVLRAGVERILAVHELGVQHHIALLALALALQVRQAVPGAQVVCAGDAAGSGRRRQVIGIAVVVPLHAEGPVYPSVLVLCQAHVIHVGGGYHVFGHGYRAVPKAEVVHAVLRFGYGEERLAVVPFHAGYQQEFPVHIYRS